LKRFAFLLFALAGCGDNKFMGTDGGSDGPQGDGSGPPDLVFATAPHPAAPQVVNYGGSVLGSPRVVPIFYTNDAMSSDLQSFIQQLAGSSYWTQVTSEYGVGPLTVLPTQTITGPAPSQLSDAQLQQILTTNLGGSTPPWGAADARNIYTFVLPPGTIEMDSGGACCTDYDGYHSQASAGGRGVAYAVACACPGFDGAGVDDLQQRTVVISHELVEAATDPFVNSAPAFAGTDDADAIWIPTSGGELADMCEFNQDAYVPFGANYMVQRTWSNAAAAADMNPCLPAPAGPFFNAVAIDQVPVTLNAGGGAISSSGFSIPVGSTKTIRVQLYSSAPTSGPWTVQAFDYGDYYFSSADTQVSLDKSTGQNGDVLMLTVTVLKANSTFAGEAIMLQSSDQNGVYNLTFALVTN
jgi:hypothetical protein